MQRIIEGMKSGGGYIFAPGHPVLQDDVPVENIITMYRSGFEYVNTKGIPTIYC
jgi:uroporphyrinogen-III decarboxylase